MQKNMRIITKGIKKLQKYDLFDSEESDLSGYIEPIQDFNDCLISPNQQYLALIQTIKQSSREGFQCQIFIKIVNLISDFVINTKIKADKVKSPITSQFSINSQYLVVLIEANIVILNIFDKLKYRLNYNVKHIISIDSNQILKICGKNQILYFSLAQKELIKQIDWKSDKQSYVIDSIAENIFIVQKLLSHQFQIIFQQKILKTSFTKFQIWFFKDKLTMHPSNFKWLPQQLLVAYRCINNLDIEKVYLYNLRSSKILRKIQNYKVSNSFSEDILRKITNVRYKNKSYYIYYLENENKNKKTQSFYNCPTFSKDNIFRFNLISGVNRKLYFRPKVIFDQIILSENVYADIYYDDKTILRHYYYKK